VGKHLLRCAVSVTAELCIVVTGSSGSLIGLWCIAGGQTLGRQAVTIRSQSLLKTLSLRARHTYIHIDIYIERRISLTFIIVFADFLTPAKCGDDDLTTLWCLDCNLERTLRIPSS